MATKVEKEPTTLGDLIVQFWDELEGVKDPNNRATLVVNCVNEYLNKKKTSQLKDKDYS